MTNRINQREKSQRNARKFVARRLREAFSFISQANQWISGEHNGLMKKRLYNAAFAYTECSHVTRDRLSRMEDRASERELCEAADDPYEVNRRAIEHGHSLLLQAEKGIFTVRQKEPGFSDAQLYRLYTGVLTQLRKLSGVSNKSNEWAIARYYEAPNGVNVYQQLKEVQAATERGFHLEEATRLERMHKFARAAQHYQNAGWNQSAEECHARLKEAA